MENINDPFRVTWYDNNPPVPPKTTLVIDRTKWLRGKEVAMLSISVLLERSNKKMCCLGFLSKSCGYTDSQIEGIGTPSALYNHFETTKILTHPFNKLVELSTNTDYKYQGTSEGWELMRANDNELISENEREERLTKLFKTYLNIDLEFIN